MDSQLCSMDTSILMVCRVGNTCRTLHFCCIIIVSCALFQNLLYHLF